MIQEAKSSDPEWESEMWDEKNMSIYAKEEN